MPREPAGSARRSQPSNLGDIRPEPRLGNGVVARPEAGIQLLGVQVDSRATGDTSRQKAQGG